MVMDQTSVEEKVHVSSKFIENIFRSGLTLVSSTNNIITIKIDKKYKKMFVKNHKKINKWKDNYYWFLPVLSGIYKPWFKNDDVQDVLDSLQAKLGLTAMGIFSLVVEHVKSLKRNKLTLLNPRDTLSKVRIFLLLNKMKGTEFFFPKSDFLNSIYLQPKVVENQKIWVKKNKKYIKSVNKTV